MKSELKEQVEAAVAFPTPPHDQGGCDAAVPDWLCGTASSARPRTSLTRELGFTPAAEYDLDSKEKLRLFRWNRHGLGATWRPSRPHHPGTESWFPSK